MPEEPATPRPPGVFLAHAPADSAQADALDALLRAGGARTAVDESRDLSDELPAEPVLQDLGACDVLLVVWSSAAAEDAHVAEQRTYAADFGKPCLVWPLDGTDAPEGAEQMPPGSSADDAAAAVHQLLDRQPSDAPPAEDGTAVGPGRWTIESDARDGDVLEAELTGSSDGDGSSSAEQSGHLTGVHRRAGLEGRLTGRWWSTPAASRLDLELESSFGLHPVREQRHLQLRGGPGALTAEDVHGIADPRTYRLTRGNGS
ncbi:hypothetical protein [Streptomyces sp. NPDC021020]|uniref:hypothetical protein n=1 Tax=Streptomyces sp. NPDC021020 TaxID=3365109 RepID=UPI003796F9FC